MSISTPQSTRVLLDSMAKLKAARRPLEREEELKCSDALCLAPFEGKGYELWVSSPNMEFVPEVPTHKWGEALSFYADGMMGAFELFKWPQFYDDQEPHACAAPGNPALLTNTCWNTRPLVDDNLSLPSFGSGAEVVWASFDRSCFDEIADTGTAHVGFISAAFLSRLKKATEEARRHAIPLMERLYAHEDAVDAKDERRREQRRFFMWQIVLRLQRTLSHLEDVPMPSFEVTLWAREAQRLLLELQAWVNYHAVIKPRIDDPDFNSSKHVLPLRGVITIKPDIVDAMFRAGVPVWWVRPASSLSSSMRVVHVREWVSSAGCLSQEKEMHHGVYSCPAPTLVESSVLGDGMRGLGDHIRRFSISSRPTMGALAAALPDDRDDGAAAVSVVAKPGSLQDNVKNGEPPRKKVKLSKSTSSQGGAPALDKPSWLPATQEPWDEISRQLPDLVPNSMGPAILYAFPPISLFFVSGDVLAMRVHNWIRVRRWWLGQALNSLNDRAILMTTNYWRIALEGRYFRFDFDPYDTGIRPASSLADIAKLPPFEEKGTPAKNNSKAKGRHGSKSNTRGRPDSRSIRKSAKRLDINVHFGVRGGFPPYAQNQSVSWRGHPVTFAEISLAPQLYATIITWELSVLNFRIDLCLADRQKLPGLYESKDNVRIVQREDALRAVWDKNGSMRPHWESGDLADEFGDVVSRPAAFARLAHVLADWPGASPLLPDARLTTRIAEGRESSDVTKRFAIEVGLVYARLFHDVFSRLPTMPLQMPSSLHSLVPSAWTI
ncbi:hypothetical protein EWM64_g8516 [Hericium alpestre]|uniref:Uncharacterized protein n=1 Tax=Hericium alpestre TaxID=135208 RepID=A0A4Y9ZMK5_9AGAM|nr:hypothetical protein EWM64_g8516 [Hericium alpestre]